MDCRKVLLQGKGRGDISVHVLLQFGSEADAERVRTGEKVSKVALSCSTYSGS